MQPNEENLARPFLNVLLNAQRCFLFLMFMVSLTLGSFASGVWAFVAIGGAVFLTAINLITEQQKPKPDAAYLLLCIVGLSAIGILNIGSIRFDLSWKIWVNLMTTFVPLCFLLGSFSWKKTYHPTILIVIVTAFILGALGIGLELFLGGPILKFIKGPEASLSEYNRGVSYLVIISFPIMAILYCSKYKWCIVPFIILLLFPASFTDSRASKLSLLLGVIVVILSSYWPKQIKRTLQISCVTLLSWPYVINLIYPYLETLKNIPNSWRARLEIWDYMSYRIMEHAWFGWGLGTSSVLPVGSPYSNSFIFTNVPAGHPHNAITQLWVELGVPGIILGLVFALYTLNRISRMDYRIQMFGFGIWTATVCLSCVAYNFWTDSFFSVCAISAVTFKLLEYHLESLNATVRGWSSECNPYDSQKIKETFNGPTQKIGF